MFVLINIVDAIMYLVSTALWMYSLIVIAYCLMSWVNPDPYNPIVRFLRSVTEPALWRIRKYIPFCFIGGFDLSPIILIIGIKLFEMVVLRSLGQALVMLAG